MKENPETNISKIEITTRVVLTEKAPFYVTVLVNDFTYHGIYLVRQCVSEDELGTLSGFNINDYYVVVKGRCKGELINKSFQKRIKK